jgi:hypothetical protein
MAHIMGFGMTIKTPARPICGGAAQESAYGKDFPDRER